MRVILITNPNDIPAEKNLIQALIQEGLVDIHFRKPDFSLEQAEQYLMSFTNEVRSKIVTHQFPELALKLGLKGIHFTGKTNSLLGNYADYEGSKSISTHSYMEIEQWQGMNYYFLSPIFKSISKQNYGGEAFDFNELKNFLQLHRQKEIIALGGITKTNIKEVKQLGFAGVALLGSVWNLFVETNSIDIVKKYMVELRTIWNEA